MPDSFNTFAEPTYDEHEALSEGLRMDVYGRKVFK